MLTPVIFMFSGQGSQFYQMGRELYLKDPIFAKWMREQDLIVESIIGRSLLDVIYAEDVHRHDRFSHTSYSHPALFMVQFAMAKSLMDKGVQPDYLLGASLGELICPVFADSIDLEVALASTLKQAAVLEGHCPPGGMLSILHHADLYWESSTLFQNSELAAVNFDSHFVVSGETEKLDEIEKYLKKKRIICERLPVTQGFHSSLMDTAAPIFKNELKAFEFRKPKIPIISCTRAGIVSELKEDHFWAVVREPIQFQKTIQQAERKGSYIYLDLSPSGTLATFVKYNLGKSSKSKQLQIMTLFGSDLANFKKIQDYLENNRAEQSSTRTPKAAYVFPGQGSQSKGMGRDLFDDFKDLTARADRILGYSIKDLCLNDRDGRLVQTQYTQPAIFVISVLSYLKKIQEGAKKPDYVAGHSLGEFNALFAAEVFDFDTGLELVKKRGQLMSQASGGGMAAVIGASETKIREILEIERLTGIDIANYNAPSQIVISGLKTEIECAAPLFKKNGVRFVPLPVSAAFHSRYMKEAGEEFGAFLKKFEFNQPTIPVISNVHAIPYASEELKENLTRQITHSVRWIESIQYLLDQGVTEFEEVGPGSVLTSLIKRIKNEYKILPKPTPIESNVPTRKQQTTRQLKKQDSDSLNRQLKLTSITISPESLGDEAFKREYDIKYAYVAGGMYRGIASKELVVKMGKAGLIGYFGTGGLKLSEVEEAILEIKQELGDRESFGFNLLNNVVEPELEDRIVDLFLKHDIRNIEAAAYLQMSPALVRYRLSGLSQEDDGGILVNNRIMAKVSRPEIARLFLSPAPEPVVMDLLAQHRITARQAELAPKIAMADDICVEADSGGHTDQGSAPALLPVMLKMRSDHMAEFQYKKRIRIGTAGGIGTPEAAASAFVLGADFVLTGSINQCTVEAGNSDLVKDLLQEMNVQDTDYAPAGDMFEMGAKVQVLRKGVFFPARANKLFELYRRYGSLEEIDDKNRQRIESDYFKRTFAEVYEEVKKFYPATEIEKAERNAKHKMALVFRWYFGRSTRLAMEGDERHRVDFQVHTGPALGAFNQWVKGTGLQDWRNRHVDEIAEKIMIGTAALLNRRIERMLIKN